MIKTKIIEGAYLLALLLTLYSVIGPLFLVFIAALSLTMVGKKE